MGTKLENAAKREANVAKMEAQLKDWATQLDGLVVGYLEAGAQQHDEYRLRVDALRDRHSVVQAKLNEYQGPAVAGAVVPGSAWGPFRASIAEDWSALEAGFKDLSITP